MPKALIAALSLVALPVLAASALAQGAPPPRPDTMTPEERASMTAAMARPSGPGSGPYPAIMEVDPTLANHVVYRPADLAALGKRKLGVLIWGNGGCRDDGASARHHLLEIASHGYLAIAPGRVLSGPTATERPTPRETAPDGRRPAPATTAADVRAGLDWALAENLRKGSRYRGRIDPALAAVGGHSCGGLQAIEVASDPRIRTVLVHNSGIFNGGVQSISGYMVSKDLLRGFHTPVVYFLGGPADVAWPNGTDDVQRIDHVPVVQVMMPVGHGGTFGRINGGAVAQASVDWLDWQLRGDKTAARTFVGETCRLCTVPTWEVLKKKVP